VNHFGAQVVKVATKDEMMMVNAFRKGIFPDSFSESLSETAPRPLLRLGIVQWRTSQQKVK